MSRRRRKEGRWAAEGRAAMDYLGERQRSWVPVPLAEHVVEENLVIVLAPKFQNPVGRAMVNLFRKDQEYRLHLDEFGSAVWELIDGRRNVGQIADALVDRFGEKVEPGVPRLLKFLKWLGNAGVVRVTTLEKPAESFK
jgi:hypothetical protein